MASFNLQLKRIRKQAKLTQDEMADRMGIKVSRYQTWEQGRAMMSLEQAFQATEILNCTLEELVGRSPSRKAYADPKQEALNRCYESMDEHGRATLVNTAELMSGNIEKASKSEMPPDSVRGIA